MLSIGFVLLTHNNEQQMLRLVNALNQVFSHPQIACHHDFSKTHIEPKKFSANVRFVADYEKTRWGDLSLVKGTLKGIRLLYSSNGPDWFYLISGSDYPIRSGNQIREELSQTSCDVFMAQHAINHNVVPPKSPQQESGFSNPHYARLGYERYIGRSLPIPHWRHPWRGPAAGHIRILNPWVLKYFHPFTSSYRCVSGDQWFVGNGRAADYILSEQQHNLLRYFKGRFPPDEAFFHTLLSNAVHLRVCAKLRHFIRWDGGNHPRMLELEDLPEILASDAHFARKFAPGSSALTMLDTALAIRPIK